MRPLRGAEYEFNRTRIRDRIKLLPFTRSDQLPYKTYNKQNICIYYQDGFLDKPEVLFERRHRGARNSASDKSICDTGAGDTSTCEHAETKRGNALFFDYKGTELTLKHYFRGGVIGRLVRDTYGCLPGSTPRMLAEFQLLYKLRKQKLPVPVPVAARCMRSGLLRYRGDLITMRIPGAVTLSQHLNSQSLGVAQWRRIGEMLARFHAANVYHADLNATNILLDKNQQPWLIDFDKSGIRADGDWKLSNLKRLRRSLDKLRRNTPGMHFREDDWGALLEGYEGPAVSSVGDRPFARDWG